MNVVSLCCVNVRSNAGNWVNALLNSGQGHDISNLMPDYYNKYTDG